MKYRYSLGFKEKTGTNLLTDPEFQTASGAGTWKQYSFDQFLNLSKNEEHMIGTKKSTTIEPFIVPQSAPSSRNSIAVPDSNVGIEYDAAVEPEQIESASPSQKSVVATENVTIMVEESAPVEEEEEPVEEEVVEEVVVEEVILEVVEPKKKGKPRKKKGT